MFYCGMYLIEWKNANDEIVKSEKKYLTYPLYRQEMLNMQIASLRGSDVKKMVVTPIEK